MPSSLYQYLAQPALKHIAASNIYNHDDFHDFNETRLDDDKDDYEMYESYDEMLIRQETLEKGMCKAKKPKDLFKALDKFPVLINCALIQQ